MAVGRPPLEVACVGDNTLDVYVPPVGRTLVGGSCLNVAVDLARAGISSAYLGAIGDDAAGELVRRTLELAGVDVRGLRVEPDYGTAVTEIRLGPGGERTFLNEAYEIHEQYAPDAGDWELLEDVGCIHASRLPEQLAALRARGRSGVLLSYDFTTDPVVGELDGIGVAFVSGDAVEPGAHAEVAAGLRARGAACAVVTLGEAGAYAVDGDGEASVAAEPVAEIVDTCGAGDAFIAGFLAAQLRRAPLGERLRAGAHLGAVACTHLGAFPQEGAV